MIVFPKAEAHLALVCLEAMHGKMQQQLWCQARGLMPVSFPQRLLHLCLRSCCSPLPGRCACQTAVQVRVYQLTSKQHDNLKSL